MLHLITFHTADKAYFRTITLKENTFLYPFHI